MFGEEGYFSNITNAKPPLTPFAYFFIGLGSCIDKSAGVKPKWIQKSSFKNLKSKFKILDKTENQTSKSDNWKVLKFILDF